MVKRIAMIMIIYNKYIKRRLLNSNPGLPNLDFRQEFVIYSINIFVKESSLQYIIKIQ